MFPTTAQVAISTPYTRIGPSLTRILPAAWMEDIALGTPAATVRIGRSYSSLPSPVRNIYRRRVSSVGRRILILDLDRSDKDNNMEISGVLTLIDTMRSTR
jgi:hypothetical protein